MPWVINSMQVNVVGSLDGCEYIFRDDEYRENDWKVCENVVGKEHSKINSWKWNDWNRGIDLKMWGLDN